MGNKWGALEAIVEQLEYDITAIMETWWDKLHDWRAAMYTMDNYKLFRRGRQGRRGVG